MLSLAKSAAEVAIEHTSLNTDLMLLNCRNGTVDLRTGKLDDAVWARWLSWDPVRMVPLHVPALRSQRAIWVDAGRSDQYRLDIGAEAFVAELSAIGVTDVAFELFDATHGGIDWRYPLSLAYLAERLSPPT